MVVELPYGRAPYPLDLGSRDHDVLEPAPPPPLGVSLDDLLDGALDEPIGRPRLDRLVAAGARITLIVSDATRDEPRAALVAAVLRRLPDVELTLAIATGTHGPTDLSALGMDDLLTRHKVINHDGHDDRDLVDLGTTPRGTPVRLHRCLVDADLVIATGCIRPHYFAGFGAGVKAIFPGLGQTHAIRTNHTLKTEPSARAGVVADNPCRADLEDAVGLLKTPTFLLNGVCATDGRIHAAVAGDPVEAFRSGAELARPWFTVSARSAPLVIASDAPPVTDSLYQAAKIAAAVAPLVAPNGRLVIAAACESGVGPLEVVNEAILRIGVLPRLSPGVRLELASTLGPDIVAKTLIHPIPSPAHALASTTGKVLVVPRASQLIVEALRV